MANNPREKNWTVVYCPVCNNRLGAKRRDEIVSFICETEGCSQTKHFFYPGRSRKPDKSVPWFSYHQKKSKCECPNCESRR